MRRSAGIGTLWLCAWLVMSTAGEAVAQMGGGFPGGGRRRGDDTRAAAREPRSERPVTMPDAASYEQIDYRLSLLQDDLRLRADQTQAWQAFAGKSRAFAADTARERARGTSASQAAGLAHVGQAVDVARNRLTALEEVETAAKLLYATLNSEQKALADARLPSIVAPRAIGPPPAGAGANLPDPGPGAPTRP